MKYGSKSKITSNIIPPLQKTNRIANSSSMDIKKYSEDAKNQQYPDSIKPSYNLISPRKQAIKVAQISNNKIDSFFSTEKLSRPQTSLSMSINKNQKSVQSHLETNPEQLIDQRNQFQLQKKSKLNTQEDKINNSKVQNLIQINRISHFQRQKRQLYEKIDSKSANKQQNNKLQKNISYKDLYYKKYGKKPQKKQSKQYLQLINQSMVRYNQKFKTLGKEKAKGYQPKKKKKLSLPHKNNSAQKNKITLHQIIQNQQQYIDQDSQNSDKNQNKFTEIPNKNSQQNNPSGSLNNQKEIDISQVHRYQQQRYLQLVSFDFQISKQVSVPLQIQKINFQMFSHQKIQQFDTINTQQFKNNKSVKSKSQTQLNKKSYKQTIIDDYGNIIDIKLISIVDLGYCNLLIVQGQQKDVSIKAVN